MLTLQEKTRFLQKTKPFDTLPDQHLDHISRALRVVEVAAGEAVFKKGDLGNSLYLVQRGQLRVHDGDLTFRVLDKGALFGEMAALDPGPRSATVTAETDSRLFELEQEEIYQMMSSQVEVAQAIIQLLSQHLRSSSESWVGDFLQREALAHELEIGRKIQSSFLPQNLPQIEGWELAAFFQAARQVAGDFYDAFPLPQVKRMALIVGDVCDKGVGAALFMTLFRSLLRATATSDILAKKASSQEDTRSILINALNVTNNYIARTHSQTNMFATIFFAALDPLSGSLIYVNAGHDRPLVFNSDGVQMALESTGPAAGLFPDMTFDTEEIHLAPGDGLLAYSDGVIDARNKEDAHFTSERLLSLLRAHAGASSSALLEHLEITLNDYMGEAQQFDDLTMLCIKRSV